MDPTSMLLGAGGSFNPSIGLLMAQQPNVFADAAAANGIPPPPLNAGAPQVPSLGNSMEPIPASGIVGQTVEAPTWSIPVAGTPGASSAVNALRGFTAPKPPDVQKITTPHAPTPHGTIQQGQLLQLLQSLGVGAPPVHPLALR